MQTRSKPTPAYVICATPRTGSTLLCDLLAGTGVAGNPDSFYRTPSIGEFISLWGLDLTPPYEGKAFEHAYLQAALREGRAGTDQFGIRIMWPSLPEMDARFAPLFPGVRTMPERLAAAFGAPVYIHLSRKDKLAQAISRVRAEQTGLWHRHADGSERERVATERPPEYDADAIAAALAEAEMHERNWTDWLTTNDIAPVTVIYEELADRPHATLAALLAALGHDPALAERAEVKTARLTDAINRSWAERFRQQTGYAGWQEGI